MMGMLDELFNAGGFDPVTGECWDGTMGDDELSDNSNPEGCNQFTGPGCGVGSVVTKMNNERLIRPRTEEEISHVRQLREEAIGKIGGWLSRNNHIAPEKVAEVESDIKKCFAYMTLPMIQRVMENMTGVNLFANHEKLSDSLTALSNGKQRHAAGACLWQKTAGINKVRLYLDAGGYKDTIAHELGHALDGHKEYSGSVEWQKAWNKEINGEGIPLTAYAKTSPEEGFAEFHRLLLSSPKEARQLFPECVGYLKSQGMY